MALRWVTIGLGGALLMVQADLWIGRGSLPHRWSLERQLAQVQAANTAARERNTRVAAEVADLKEGLEMVEDRARRDLGMLRPDEILVQVGPRR